MPLILYHYFFVVRNIFGEDVWDNIYEETNKSLPPWIGVPRTARM